MKLKDFIDYKKICPLCNSSLELICISDGQDVNPTFSKNKVEIRIGSYSISVKLNPQEVVVSSVLGTLTNIEITDLSFEVLFHKYCEDGCFRYYSNSINLELNNLEIYCESFDIRHGDFYYSIRTFKNNSELEIDSVDDTIYIPLPRIDISKFDFSNKESILNKIKVFLTLK